LSIQFLLQLHMAKKNKKASRINIKIRNFFGSDPFDVGIERVDTHTLVELAHAIGLYDVEFSKPELVRAFRQLYSTADLSLRSDILDFFIANKTLYPPPCVKEPTQQKEEKLEALMDEFEDVTPQERAELFGAFLDVRAKKITYAKIESKLRHLRFEKRKQWLQKQLEGSFDLEDRFEFYASLHVKYKAEEFHKIVVLTTERIDIEALQHEEEEKLIEHITALKAERTHRAQRESETFVMSLQSPHPYLSDAEILAALKSASPSDDVRLPGLDAKLLRKIISGKIPLQSLHLQEDDIVVVVEATFDFAQIKNEKSYELFLHLERDGLLGSIWQGKPLYLQEKMQQEKALQEEVFLEEFEALLKECQKNAALLEWSEEEIVKRVWEILLGYLGNTLGISPKTARKTLYTFNKSIQEQLQRRQRQALLARTIREFKDLFPIARQMKRELIFHAGPTNSGKTYQATEALKAADTGYYLAPLRLLALEGYENLIKEGLQASLITGEEQIIDEEATHISSTIEMLNFEVDVDVCVIDEVQMIDDRDRGWAWANAIIGAPAKKVIMTGSTNALEAIKELALYLGEKLTIVEFERKNPLRLHVSPTAIDMVEPQSAIIAFSRKEVLRLKQNFSRKFKISVVYGNLSPEVRREEARRFREKETDILIATDAIAMGLNLPIKTILFSSVMKFDGQKDRVLTPSEVQQIAGRAGRYGIEEVGYIGAFKSDALHVVANNLAKKPHNIKIPFRVMANLDHIKLVGSILEEKSLSAILEFFVKNMQFNGPFRAANIEGMLEAARIVDEYDLDIATKYHLACAPLTLKSPFIVGAFERYIMHLEQKLPIHYIAPQIKESYAQTMEELLEMEDRVKEITLYLWLSYRFGEYFVDVENARHFRGVINRYIENSLQQSHFVPRCKICGKPLPINPKYAICQSCFRKKHRRR
jgi:ATP-dependent RNA helicase SUPV3L1/SUV3